MKKLIMSITMSITILLFCLCLLTYNFYNDSSIDDTSINNIKPQNMLSIMLEGSAGSGNYEMSTLNSWPTDGYVFNSELSKCENGGTLSWDKTNKRVEFSGNNIDKCYVYFDVDTSMSLAEYVVSQYTGTQGVNGIYYHDANLTNGAGDNSYRYAGANPNNYVCFGSDDATCPHENLYRIIGLIDGKVKLILADGATTDMLGTDEGYVDTYQAALVSASSYYKGNGDLTKIGTYKWNKSGTNTWSTSTTNTRNLNTNYLTYLDSKNTKWKTMIDDTTWYVGGMASTNGVESNAKTAYDYEVGANKDATTTVISKIGMMYVSDYYYAASKDYWTLPGYNSSGNDYSKAVNDNWLYTGLYECTISRRSDSFVSEFVVHGSGSVGDDDVGNSNGNAARPTFNLSSSIKFTSGEGTVVNPIRIQL